MNQQSLLDGFNPESFGFVDKEQKQKRKHFPGESYILNKQDGDVELYISTDFAEEAIEYFGINTFCDFIDGRSGCIFYAPMDKETAKRKKNRALTLSRNGGAHYCISLTRKKRELFDAAGDFTRLFVVVVINTNHLLIVPDRKNKNNEYQNKSGAQ